MSSGVDFQLAQCMRHVVVAPAAKSERHGVCNRLVPIPRPRPFLFFPFSPVFVIIGCGVDDHDLADTGLAVDGCSRRQYRCFVLRYPCGASSILMHSLEKGDGLGDGRLREHECKSRDSSVYFGFSTPTESDHERSWPLITGVADYRCQTHLEYFVRVELAT
jgi:hypothetical protein